MNRTIKYEITEKPRYELRRIVLDGTSETVNASVGEFKTLDEAKTFRDGLAADEAFDVVEALKADHPNNAPFMRDIREDDPGVFPL